MTRAIRSSRSVAMSERYSNGLIAVHWVTAMLVAAAIGIGLYMVGLSLSPSRIRLYNWHKWIGVTVFVLTMARLVIRRRRGVPASAEMPAWQGRAAAVSHRALYALMVLVPILGWAYSSAAGFPVVWFGVLPLPAPFPVDADLAGALKPCHRLAAWALMGLAFAHAGAAVKHQFFDGDGLIWRMIPAFGRKGR